MMSVTDTFGFSHFIASADALALVALAILCVMSIVSWSIILLKTIAAFRIKKENLAFLHAFKSDPDVSHTARFAKTHDSIFSSVAIAGFEGKESAGLPHAGAIDRDVLKSLLTSAIKSALDDETARVESGLTALATIGSTAPFVGLLGTVWGIYSALMAIGASGAGTLDKIASPVGEALIMTGLGLFVAIPAVIGYNGLTRFNRVWLAKLDSFAFQWQERVMLSTSPKSSNNMR